MPDALVRRKVAPDPATAAMIAVVTLSNVLYPHFPYG